MDEDVPAPSWPSREPSRWSVVLPKDLGAPRTARAAIDDWLSGAPARIRDDARSLVTELVAAAVEDGRPPITVKLERTASDWLLEVSDGGAQRARRSARFERPGWASRIVDLLAESWGTGENGSRVWCRLHPVDAGVPDRRR
jgi:hypothetical protein